MAFANQNIPARLSEAFIRCGSHVNEERKNGETLLGTLALDRGYPLYLLEYIANEDQAIPAECKLRAAIEFKRWVNSDWTKPSLQDIQFSEVHIEIKNVIIKVWIQQQQKKIEELLRESIITIAKYEFPFRWENLTTTLMSGLNANDITSSFNYRIFKLLAKIMAKYEYSSRSDELFTEIILASDTTHDYLLHFATTINNLLTQNVPNDITAVKQLLAILKQVLRCFFLLNSQDLPEKFENNLNSWMQILSQVLTLELDKNPEIKMDVFKCKGESLKSILLYFTKYKDDVGEHVQLFSQQIYTACMQSGDEQTDSKFMLNAMKFFKSLLYWSDLKGFFSENMKSMLETLVFRMEKPTADDGDVFDGEPDGFIENVFNNAGGNSRKNTVHDLARTLAKTFNSEVIPVLQGLVQNYVQSFQNGQTDPITEITIINILIDMGVTKFTPRMGVSEVILPLEFYTFFYSGVVEPSLAKLFELSQSDPNFKIDNVNLFHVSHLVRYVFFFRNYIDKGKLLEVIKNLSYIAKTTNETFKRVVYYSIEGLIAIRDSLDIFAPSKFFYNKNNVYPQLQYVLENIYLDIKATADLSPYVLKALFNIIKVMEDSCANFTAAFCDLFKDMIEKLTKSYNFTTIFSVFDNLANFITYTKDNNDTMQAVHQAVFPQLDKIISANHADMLSYAFQIYALGIHFYNLPTENINLIFNSLMNLKNWEKDNLAMFPAYLMFIEEIIVKQPDLLWNNLQTIQGILSAVLIENQQDLLFFTFVNKVAIFFDLQPLRESGLLNAILQIILKAICETQTDINNKENNKPTIRGSLGKSVLLFWSLCIAKFSFEEFIQDVQAAFGNNFGIFYNFLIQEINFIKQYQRQPERKVLMNGIEGIIFSSLYDQIPNEIWSALLNAVVENMFRRRKSKLYSDMGDGATKQVLTGSASNFQKLSWFASQKLPYADLPDEDARFIQEFQAKFANMAGQILQQVISPNLQKFFEELFQQQQQ